MAELLIKAVDATHPDPDTDRRACYKRGDIVAVMPDGHTWGDEECLPKFYVVRIPGLSVEDARILTEPAYVLGNAAEFGIAHRRRYRFPFWSKIPHLLQKIESSNWFVPDIDLQDIEDK